MTAPPLWFDAESAHDCARCPASIAVGDPAAWLPCTDELVCFDCGDQIDAARPTVAR